MKIIRQDCKSWPVLNAVGGEMKIWIGRKNSSICVAKPAPGFRPCCATCRLVPIRWSSSWPLAASSEPPGPGQHSESCLHSSWMGRRGERVFSVYHLNAWGNSGQYFLQEKVFYPPARHYSVVFNSVKLHFFRKLEFMSPGLKCMSWCEWRLTFCGYI